MTIKKIFITSIILISIAVSSVYIYFHYFFNLFECVDITFLQSRNIFQEDLVADLYERKCGATTQDNWQLVITDSTKTNLLFVTEDDIKIDSLIWKSGKILEIHAYHKPITIKENAFGIDVKWVDLSISQ